METMEKITHDLVTKSYEDHSSHEKGLDTKTMSNFTNFTRQFTLQNRGDWLSNLEFAFEGSPERYNSEKKRILLTQKEDQHHEAFARQLEVLERNWDRGPEKLRAEDYLTKLTDPLPRKITENNRFIPPNRREIIDLATHYWENDQDAKKRKFSQMKDGDKPSRSTQKKKSSHPTSDKPRQNPMGSDGKRTTCKSLCPDNPCSGLSRESRKSWYQHLADLSEEEKHHIKHNWGAFVDWTLLLISNSEQRLGDLQIELENKVQDKNQDPVDFDQELSVLEGYFEKRSEKEKALFFYSKLSKDLRQEISSHAIELPNTRVKIVQTALHHWRSNHWNTDKKRKRSDGDDDEDKSAKC
ncbi:uncharacterized protein N7515_000199 [Penicillium bovifimosum]|uniref:Uncharacterized protein n=1 Tax=Penicillium bovifimosum TaxID=126998 RepID=A0A9W9HGV1_9EURO|nr:uncharacterized protein N7515_000199 [Penicillium bovifimosum]KAJ5145635.1 hypothetical protein N7515_000199 [Penicillium bovifimosum]